MIPSLLITAQQVPRNKVILEIGTGTWCVYCPGAAAAADQLIEEGKDLAVIENHNGDIYTNTYSNARNSYYGISGYPTAHFDGIEEYEGGYACPNVPGPVYAEYLDLYNLRKAIQSSFTLDMKGCHTGSDYIVTLTVNKVANTNTSNCKVHFVLTESSLQTSWFCMTECNFVNRLMLPDENGTTLNLTNDQQVINYSFTLNSGWTLNNCELVAFIQYNSTKEIYQGIKVHLNQLTPPPVSADFEADETVICQGSTVHYTDNSFGCNIQYQWAFQGGTPSTSTQPNPIVVYNTAGTYDVTLHITDGYTSDDLIKTDYISVGSEAPATPSQPQGTSQLCKNPPNTDYSITPVPQTAYYVWSLVPSTAGLIMGNGPTITVNWVNAYTGIAGLTVKAVNGCGESDFSDTLFVTVSAPPTIYDVTGGGAFCEGGDGVQIGLSNSEEGVDYELYLDDVTTDIIVSGTGSPLDFGILNVSGLYTAKGTNSTTTCSAMMSSSAQVSIVSNPLVYNIQGGGLYCAGTSGIEVGLEGSQQDCDYELYYDGVATGIIVQGTGFPINFGDQTDTGDYTAIAVNTEYGCTSDMSGTAAVGIIYLPEVPSSPEGSDYVDLFYTQSSVYNTTGSANSTSYGWSMDPSNAGSLVNISLLESQVNWNGNFLGTATIKVEGINQCGESQWSEGFDVTVVNTVGVDEYMGDLGIRISPNPNTGIFKLEINSLKDEVISVSILNPMNAVIFSQSNLRVNGHYSTMIDLSHTTNGIYFLHVRTGEKNVMKKIVIQK
jgi:PKD repeat protein